jgi:sulfate transport system permease protein
MRPTGYPGEPAWVRRVLIGACLLCFSLILLLPLAAVLVNALRSGLAAFLRAISSAETASAARLTLLTAAVVVPLNTLFGLMAAWALTKFEFRGKNTLIALIDLPFSISPVISGMVFVLLFGARGAFGAWLGVHGVKIVFSTPGIVLATLFVTFPFVARELIPLMQAQGAEEEMAAATLGAGGFQTFRRVTLPNIKWALLYGVILCNARAMGEFGAVSVVSGHIRGQTNTLPLHVEILYNEYHTSESFAVASLLTVLAVVTLVLKTVVDRRVKGERQDRSGPWE